MSRVLRPVACVVAATAVLVALATLVLGFIGQSHGADVPLGPVSGVLFVIAVAVPASVGLFVALRRPANRIPWILLIGSLSVAVVLGADAVEGLALQHDRGSTLGAWAALVSQQWPVLFLWPLALAYVFPDGRLPARRWRPVAALACGDLMLMLAFVPDSETPYGDVPNPMPFTLPDSFEPVFWAFWFGLLASLIGGAVALAARYRAGDAQLRRQVLWLAYGAVLVPIWLGGGSLVARVFGSLDTVDFFGLMILQVWAAVAVAVAVTRHGLYAIDRVLNRTLVYVVLPRCWSGRTRWSRCSGASRRSSTAGSRAPGSTRCGSCATSSTRCATGMPSRRTSARRWRSRWATRAPRSCSGCRRPAPTPTATATCSSCPTTGASAR